MQFKAPTRPNEELIGHEFTTEFGTKVKVVGISAVYPLSEIIVESATGVWPMTSTMARRSLTDQSAVFRKQQRVHAESLLAAAREENRARAQLPRPSRKPRVILD